MKTYIKPTTKLVNIKIGNLLTSASVAVSGVDGLGYSSEEFNGPADGRHNGDFWDDED